MKNLIDPKLLKSFQSDPLPMKEIVEFLDTNKDISVSSLCKTLGIKPKKIYDFRSNLSRKLGESEKNKHDQGNEVIPKAASKKYHRYSAEEKFQLVENYQTAAEAEKMEILRKYGLYQSDMDRWICQIKEAAILALGKRKTRSDKKPAIEIENEELKKELSEQEKTTAKLSTLLILQKKTFDMLKKND